MGLSGALMGLGQGMQGYADSIKETQRQNWVAKQEQVKWERQQNLESLRAKNQKQLAEENRTFQAEQGALDRGARQVEIAGNQTFQTSEREAGERARIKEIAARADAEIAKQEELLTKAKEFSAQERKEKASALREIWAQDGISPMEEIKLTALEQGIDMKDIFGTSKPMSADMVKAIDGMLSKDEAYINASQQQKIQLIRDAHQRLSGGIATDKRPLLPDALARAKANRDKLTPEDLQQIPPEQIKEIFQGTGEAPTPSRTPTDNMVQGQQYMRDQVDSMPITQKIKQGYGALQGRFQQLREGK